MISDEDLLFIEPETPAFAAPLIDSLTRRMTAAFRLAEPSPWECFFGVHRCICGVCSTNCNYILPNGEKTNSLCVHYLAYHREAVPAGQLARVARLDFGEVDPTEEEVRGQRWRGNRAGDYFGKAKVAQFANEGIDLASIFFAALDSTQCDEFFYHSISNIWNLPKDTFTEFLGAVRQTQGEVGRWTAQAFWSEGWKEAWVPPLLLLLGNPNPKVREWAATSLGNIGDTQTRWVWEDSTGRFKSDQVTGISSALAQTVGRALLDIRLKDTDESVRSAAINALEKIGPLSAMSIRILLEILQSHPEESRRSVASKALQAIGLQGEEAAAILMEVKQSSTGPMVRQAMTAALERIGHKEHLPSVPNSDPGS